MTLAHQLSKEEFLDRLSRSDSGPNYQATGIFKNCAGCDRPFIAQPNSKTNRYQAACTHCRPAEKYVKEWNYGEAW